MGITPIGALIKQYSAETYVLEKYRRGLNVSDPLAAEEYQTVAGMIADMRYALDWMKRGRRPGNRRGVERADVYRQRELLSEARGLAVSDEERLDLVKILLKLSERERACFLLHMAHGLTQDEIAGKLKLSRRSVRTFVERAKSKVQQGISG